MSEAEDQRARTESRAEMQRVWGAEADSIEHGTWGRHEHEGSYGYGIGAWSTEHGRAENRELESRAHRRRSEHREQRAERIEREIRDPESEIKRRSRGETEDNFIGYHAESKCIDCKAYTVEHIVMVLESQFINAALRPVLPSRIHRTQLRK
jgi:hypothetical protein